MIKGIENKSDSWPAITITFSVLGFFISAVLYLTHTDHYQSYVVLTSVIVASILCLLSLIFLILVPPYFDGLTLVGHFALCSEILLLIYTVIPMPLYACVGIGTIYSILFEFLTAYLYGLNGGKTMTTFFTDFGGNSGNSTKSEKLSVHNFTSQVIASPILDSLSRVVRSMNSSEIFNSAFHVKYNGDVDFSTTLTIRILMQICIHIIGVHILIMTFVRMRGTFMKVRRRRRRRSPFSLFSNAGNESCCMHI